MTGKKSGPIYLMRHGRIEQFRPRRYVGQTDLPLTLAGERQAWQMHTLLQDIPFVKIVSSPLRRALETAAIVSGRRSWDIETIPALAEISLGTWEGLTVEEVRRRYPGQYEARGADLAHYRPPEGESFADLAARSLPVLTDLAQENPGPLLVVTHAGVNRVLLSRMQGLPLADLFAIPQDYCCLNIVRLENGIWQVEAINQTPDQTN